MLDPRRGRGRDCARRLAALRTGHGDRIAIVMRTYFEKPRTTVGWKGLINDPRLDGGFDMERGLRLARQQLAALSAPRSASARRWPTRPR